MLMMRLQRVGRKNDPSYRIVVVDKRTSTKSNKVTDLVGSYNPKLSQITIDADKVKSWISKGVQPSDTVYNMLVSKKIIEGKKRNALPRKTPIIDEAKLKAEADAKANEAEKTEVEEEVEVEKNSTDDESPTEETVA